MTKHHGQDRVDDLRATEEAISAEITHLARIEDDKQDLEPADPKVDELSREARASASRILGLAKSEEEIAAEIRDTEATGPISKP